MPENQFKIVAFGEVLWDLLPSGAAILGGAPFNFVHRVNERGNTGYMISRVGHDMHGQQALAKMREMDIDTSLVQRDDTHPTGTVEVFLDAHKNPDYNIIKDVAYDYIRWDEDIERTVGDADCICFGSLIQRNRISHDTLHRALSFFRGKHIFYDINLRKDCYNKEIITESLEQASILKMNNDELVLIGELFGLGTVPALDIVDILVRDFGLEYCLVTYGEGGVLAISREGEKIYRPSYRTDLVDPLGSGDAFSAGFIHALLHGQSMNASCDMGNLLGGIVASQEGATQAITDTDIRTFSKRLVPNKAMGEFKEYVTT